MPDRPDACARCRRPADESRPQWRAVGDELVCPGCLSSLESETAPLAPASPIDRYLKELSRDLEVGPLQRRRIVAEVGQHLRESSREQAEEHDLSRWQSERAAIDRMGSVDAIVAAYELSQPSSRRPTHIALVALTGCAVLAVGAVTVGMSHRNGSHRASPATPSPAGSVLVLPPDRNPITTSGNGEGCTRLRYTLAESAYDVALLVVQNSAGTGTESTFNATAGPAKTSSHGVVRTGTTPRSRSGNYWWYVAVEWQTTRPVDILQQRTHPRHGLSQRVWSTVLTTAADTCVSVPAASPFWCTIQAPLMRMR